MKKILIIGAGGQIGTELVLALRILKGNDNVVAADLKEDCPEKLSNGPYIQMDVLNNEFVRNYIIEEKITEVYLLAALLSPNVSKCSK